MGQGRVVEVPSAECCGGRVVEVPSAECCGVGLCGLAHFRCACSLRISNRAHTGTRTRDAYGTCTGRVHGTRDAYGTHTPGTRTGRVRDAYGTRTGRIRACWEVHRTQAVGRVLGRVQDAYRFPLGRKHQPPLPSTCRGVKIRSGESLQKLAPPHACDLPSPP